MDKIYATSMLKAVDSVNLRLSHPNLYRSIWIFAIISLGLGLNFIFLHPTFLAYGIPKVYVGLVFLGLGCMKVFFLEVHRSLKYVRLTLALEILLMLIWGIGTAITVFTGKTSAQLLILYLGLAAFEYILLIEPFAIPKTGRNGDRSAD